MILNYLTQKQALDSWCWAAVASSISFFYNRNQQGFQQGDIAAKLIDPMCKGIFTGNAGMADPVCDEPEDVSKALESTGNYAWELNRVLDLNEVVDQINGGFPICCQIYWQMSERAHFVTVFGYEHNNLLIGDPEAEHIFTVAYNRFLNYRQGLWNRTIGTQHP